MKREFRQSLGGILHIRKYSIIRGALRGDLNEIVEALKEDPNCINDQDERAGVTALHIAAGEGNLKIAKFLLAQPGCNAMIMDYQNRFPNYMASAIGRFDISDEINAHIARRPELPRDEDASQDGISHCEKTISFGNVLNFKPPTP